MKLKRLTITFMVGSHRALFTIATALLGVSASLVADEPHYVAHYLLLAGALLLMYVEDECSEIDTASRALGGPGTLADARSDLFETHNTKLLFSLNGIAIALLAGSFVFVATT